MGFGDSARFDLGICVTEAVNNAIRHGHGQDIAKIVEVRFEGYADGLSIVVRDHGAGFDPDSIPDPTLPENLFKTGGRGVHLIKSLMDTVMIQRFDDGMKIT